MIDCTHPMSSLQLGLIVAGVVLVVGVIVYNWLQERRIRRRIDATFRKPSPADGPADTPRRAGRSASSRRSPRATAAMRRLRIAGKSTRQRRVRGRGFRRAMGAAGRNDDPDRLRSVARSRRDARVDDGAGSASRRPLGASAARASVGRRSVPQPDPDIECMVTLQPARAGGGGRARRGTARAARQAAALVRPPRRCRAVAAAQVGHAGRIHRDRRVPAARRSQRRGDAAAARAFARLAGDIAPTLPAACRAAGHRARGRARRGARSPLRRPRRADRPHGAEGGPGDDRRHAASRRRRSGGLPARGRRPVRLGAGGDRRRALYAAESTGRSRSPPMRCAWLPRRGRCSCSTSRAWPTRCACSTR